MIDRVKQFIDNAKGIIFDLDGLLIDSEPIWEQVITSIISEYGDPKTMHIKSGTRGMGLRETILKHKEIHMLKGDVDTLMSIYRQSLYDTLLQNDNLCLMPGVKDYLPLVADCKLGIATGGHTVNKVQEIIEKLSIQKYFSVIVSCDEVVQGKPFPDVYIEAARRLGIHPGETIVLEDAVNGVLAGKAAHTLVIGINSEKETQEQLLEAGADVVVGSFEALTQ